MYFWHTIFCILYKNIKSPESKNFFAKSQKSELIIFVKHLAFPDLTDFIFLQTFVLKPAVVQPTVVESNLLPSSLQQALSQHHKAVGIQQSLQNSARMIQQPLPSYQQHLYAQHVVAPQQHVRSNPQQQQQQQQHQQQQQVRK